MKEGIDELVIQVNWKEKVIDKKTWLRTFLENFNSTELYKLLARKEQYSEYTDKVPVSKQLVTVLSELKELFEEVEKVENWEVEENEEIGKELFDVIYTLSLSIQSMVKKDYLKKEKIQMMSKEWAEKIYDRCPMLLTWDKKPLDEERRIWRERKKSHWERFIDKKEGFEEVKQ